MEARPAPENDVGQTFRGQVVQFGDFAGQGVRTLFVSACQCTREGDSTLWVSLRGVLLPTAFPRIKDVYRCPDPNARKAVSRPLVVGVGRNLEIFYYAGYLLDAAGTNEYWYSLAFSKNTGVDSDGLNAGQASRRQTVGPHVHGAGAHQTDGQDPADLNFLNGNSLCWTNAVLQIWCHLPGVLDFFDSHEVIRNSSLGAETLALLHSLRVRPGQPRQGELLRKRDPAHWQHLFLVEVSKDAGYNPFIEEGFNDIEKFFNSAVWAMRQPLDEDDDNEFQDMYFGVRLTDWSCCMTNHEGCNQAQRAAKEAESILSIYPQCAWTLPWADHATLRDALCSLAQRVVDEEKGTCNGHSVNITRGRVVRAWPTILCLHLPRFDSSDRTFRTSELDLPPNFSFAELRLPNPPERYAGNLAHSEFEGRYYLYSLTVFQERTGEVPAHHYVWTHLRAHDANAPEEKDWPNQPEEGWYLFDDYSPHIYGSGPLTYANMMDHGDGAAKKKTVLALYCLVQEQRREHAQSEENEEGEGEREGESDEGEEDHDGEGEDDEGEGDGEGEVEVEDGDEDEGEGEGEDEDEDEDDGPREGYNDGGRAGGQTKTCVRCHGIRPHE